MRFFVYITLIAALLISFAPAQAMLEGTTTVVEPANMNGWTVLEETKGNGGWGSFAAGPVNDPNSVRAGKGGARLVLKDGTAGWSFVSGLMKPGTKFAELTRLQYSTFVTQNNTTQAVALQIEVDFDVTDQNNDWQGRLVYEPYRNGAVAKGEWQAWNTIDKDAKWFATRGTNCPMSNPCTMGYILENFPNAGFHPLYGVVRFKAGSSWVSAFDGNFDKFIIGVANIDDIYDFEPASTVYVDDDWSAVAYGTDPDGAEGPAHLMGFDASATVQGGVNLVAPNGTVKVAAGTYPEQVIVRNVEGITIEGAGESSTSIVSPTQLVFIKIGADNRFGVVMADNVDALALKNLTIDGAGRGNAHYKFYGVVYHNTGGLLDHLTVKGIRNEPLDGGQHGIALYAYNEDGAPRLLTAQNNTIFDYQKGGIVFNGAGLQVNLIDNTITGVGPTSVIAMNGVQIGFGAKGLIEGNTITGHEYTGEGWSASGLILYDEEMTLTGNTIEDNQVGLWSSNADSTLTYNRVANNGWGIFIGGGTADVVANTIVDNEYGVDVYGNTATSALVTHNRIVDNTNAIVNEVDGANVPTVDATDNWWGCNEGPNTTDCDSTTGPVTAGTWLMLTLTTDQTHVLEGRPANLVATITINSAGENVSNVPSFPDGKPVAFTTTAGSFSEATDGLKDGSAQTVLSVTNDLTYGPVQITAALDYETVRLDLFAGLFRYWMPIVGRPAAQ